MAVLTVSKTFSDGRIVASASPAKVYTIFRIAHLHNAHICVDLIESIVPAIWLQQTTMIASCDSFNATLRIHCIIIIFIIYNNTLGRWKSKLTYAFAKSNVNQVENIIQMSKIVASIHSICVALHFHLCIE